MDDSGFSEVLEDKTSPGSNPPASGLIFKNASMPKIAELNRQREDLVEKLKDRKTFMVVTTTRELGTDEV